MGLTCGGKYISTKHFTRWDASKKLEQPLRWRKSRHIELSDDLFHKDVPFEFAAAVFGVMACCQRHTFQILTKRPERMAWFLEWMTKQATPHTTEVAIAQHHAQRKCGAAELKRGENFAYWTWPLPNVWLGTSVENQQAVDERIPHLLRCPAAVRFVSQEPQLSRVVYRDEWAAGLHQIIVGGESGPNARSFDVAWAYHTLDWCTTQGIAFFLKQLGASPFALSKPDGVSASKEYHREYGDCWLMQLKDKKGGDISEFPADLRVRQFPAIQSAAATQGTDIGESTKEK